MAEGGYDPETTNPFDPHGDDHDDGDDNENIPLIPIPKEKPPSHKYPWSSTPIQHSSTSAHHNPSFFPNHTASGRLHTMEVFQDIGAEQIKEVFPNTDTSKYFSKMDGDGTIYVKIKKGVKNIWHPIIDKDGEVIMGEGRKKFPKTLRDAVGKTVGEIMMENFDENKRAEERIKELQEQRENAFPEDWEGYDTAIAKEQERMEEGNQEIEAMEEKLSLRQRIKEIFKKHGFTVIAVTTAIATVIGVIVSNLRAGLTKVAKGVGNGLKELGKKLGEILPGMIGAIASFLFRTAGEVIGFLAKNAWLLIVGLVVLAVEQFKKRSR